VLLKHTEIQYFRALGNAVRLVIIVLAIIVGLRQVGVDVQLIENALIVCLAAVALAVALTFGMGAGTIVASMIAINQLKRIYGKGQRVKIDGIEGRIVEFIKSAVILDTDTGRAMIPARTFQERASILLDEEEVQ
jgi:small-conductance mechanosensitive channel